jgi:TIR domain
MPFEYSCFLSYRTGKYTLIQNIVSDLFARLSGEIEMFLEEPVYRDSERLQGGDFFNQQLAAALCQSVCMIAVYTPRYFSKTNPYCAQEYHAMELIENQRLNSLPAPQRKYGLIIPVVISGLDTLPEEIKKNRVYYDFSEFRQADVGITKPRAYYEGLRTIAEYIAGRHTALSKLANDPCDGCDASSFPEVEVTKEWMKKFEPPRSES